ncbi:MAG: Flp pilus assembly protein CpaB [Rhodobacteraceae bacterium]|nr:Flp pilus assembly protein CpaB [Paracoccaceae bacterium]
MRMVFGLVLLVGLGLAGFAVYMAQGFINQTQAELAAARASAAPNVPTKDIVIITRPINYGERLTPEDTALVTYPEIAIPEGAFFAFEELFPENNPAPRTILRPMEKHEPILAVKVTDPGEEAGVQSILSKGMRAFTIRVNVQSGVSGFLAPGDLVDVLWTGTSQNDDGERRSVTKLLRSSMKVIAIDQSIDPTRERARIAKTVTIEAEPVDVVSLAQAQSSGALSLSLVGANDNTVSDVIEIGQVELLGIEEREVVEVERARVCTIRTRRGAEVVEIPIPCRD